MIVLLIFSGLIFQGCEFKPKRYRGHGYTIIQPKGWKMKKEKFSTFNLLVSEEIPSAIVFYSPEKDPIYGESVAKIELISQNFTKGVFIEDITPQLYGELRRQKKTILKKGEIKVDNEKSSWVLYRDNEKDLVTIEFYLISNAKIFYKLRIVSHPSVVTHSNHPMNKIPNSTLRTHDPLKKLSNYLRKEILIRC